MYLWLIVSAIAAPMVLLRSEKSEALGGFLFSHYWGSPFTSKKQKKFKDLSISIKIIMFILITSIIWLYFDYCKTTYESISVLDENKKDILLMLWFLSLIWLFLFLIGFFFGFFWGLNYELAIAPAYISVFIPITILVFWYKEMANYTSSIAVFALLTMVSPFAILLLLTLTYRLKIIALIILLVIVVFLYSFFSRDLQSNGVSNQLFILIKEGIDYKETWIYSYLLFFYFVCFFAIEKSSLTKVKSFAKYLLLVIVTISSFILFDKYNDNLVTEKILSSLLIFLSGLLLILSEKYLNIDYLRGFIASVSFLVFYISYALLVFRYDQVYFITLTLLVIFIAVLGMGSLLLGIWVISILIRVFASLCYPIDGLMMMPNNLRNILWNNDFTYLPELIPGGSKIDQALSVKGLINYFDSDDGEGWRSLAVIAIVFWHVPNFLWRWSLKGTLWLWWPIALLLREPFEKRIEMEIRDITALRIHRSSKLLPVFAIVVMLWLSTNYFPLDKISLLTKIMGDDVKSLFDALLVIVQPPSGLRGCLIFLCCIITIVFWWKSDSLKVQHKKILEEEDILDGLDKDRKVLFIKRAKRLDQIHIIRIVSFIFLGYVYILYILHLKYPVHIQKIVPESVLNML